MPSETYCIIHPIDKSKEFSYYLEAALERKH